MNVSFLFIMLHFLDEIPDCLAKSTTSAKHRRDVKITQSNIGAVEDLAATAHAVTQSTDLPNKTSSNITGKSGKVLAVFTNDLSPFKQILQNLSA